MYIQFNSIMDTSMYIRNSTFKIYIDQTTKPIIYQIALK